MADPILKRFYQIQTAIDLSPQFHFVGFNNQGGGVYSDAIYAISDILEYIATFNRLKIITGNDPISSFDISGIENFDVSMIAYGNAITTDGFNKTNGSTVIDLIGIVIPPLTSVVIFF